MCRAGGPRPADHARAQLPFGLLFLGALTIVIGAA
jgi:hypothetical protein